MEMTPIQFTAGEIASLISGEIAAGQPETVITGAASVGEAEAGDIVFAESEKFAAAALRSRAAVILTSEAALPVLPETDKTLLFTAEPRAQFVRVLEAFERKPNIAPGIHASATLGAKVMVGADARVAAHVTLGDGAVLGDRVVIMAGARVGEGCTIGEDTVIYPNAVLYPGVTVGKRCLLHAGCVIGADGFGYIPVGRSLRKVPQVGTVEIQDDVEIGANSCVDRAKTGATVIGAGTKLDNLVHVGHGVKVGQSSLLIAQVGIGGGAVIGNGVILAGQSGVVDHVTIGDGARLGAQSGAISEVPAGAVYSGFPGRPHAAKLREYAAAAQMPEYIKRFRTLEKRLADLESKAGG